MEQNKAEVCPTQQQDKACVQPTATVKSVQDSAWNGKHNILKEKTQSKTMEKTFIKKPDVAKIKKAGYTVCDMHSHSTYSDGLNTAEEMAKRAQKLGIGLCLTDHNAIKGSEKLQKIKNLFTIPSIEINTYEGPHVLCYFYSFSELREFYAKRIKPFVKDNPNIRLKKTFEQTINDARDYNCVYSVAHPCGPVWTNLKTYMKTKKNSFYKKMPVFETLNGTQLRGSNIAAGKLARKLGKGGTGGSDAHMQNQIGKVITGADAWDREGFLNKIRKKHNFVMGTEDSILQRIMVHTYLMKNHIKYMAMYLK